MKNAQARAHTHTLDYTHTISLSKSLGINAVIVCQQEARCLQLRQTWRQNKILSSHKKPVAGQKHKAPLVNAMFKSDLLTAMHLQSFSYTRCPAYRAVSYRKMSHNKMIKRQNKHFICHNLFVCNVFLNFKSFTYCMFCFC